ncbi:unnamed protein product [Dovyalis caffra]|uniref:RRM domain-containing protein n=1 Tax=Dovyalis caffra TaxID=77055 RepID=A0AAV1R2R6_9ROSI|nr:unnamed protein product [Dovyalis caffra]
MHLKVLSRETAEMKMGGSWYSLKSVFTNLKDRMLRNPESYKQISSETTHSTESSEVITTQTGDSKHIAESGGSNNVLKSSEIPTDSSSTEESISTCITSHLQRRHLSEDAVNTTASVVMEMQGSPDDIKHNEHDGTVQVASSIISDNPKEVMLENGKRLLQELASGAIVEPTNNQNKGVGHLIYLADRLFEDAFDTSQNKIVNESASIRNTEFHLEKKTATLVERVKIDGSKLNERPPSSDGLVDLFKMTVSNKTAAEMGSVNGDLSAASESFSNHDGTSLKKVERSFDFSGLIDHIRMLPGVPAQDNAMCAIDNIQSQVELQKSDSESRNTVLKGRAVGKNSKKTGEIKKGQSVKAMTKDEGGNLLIAEKDHIKLEKNPQVPLQTSKKGSNQTVLTCFSEGHTENKVLLRFLHKDVRDSDIISYFRNFGPISKIKKVSSVKGSNFFDAILHFEVSA